MTTKQITICGHIATIEQNGANIVFTFTDKTQDGANGLQVKLYRCGVSICTKAWHKAGLTPTELQSWWSVAVATPHEALGYDSPWLRNEYNPTRTADGKQDFSWIIEATDGNAKRLLEEIVKRAYGSEAPQPETATGSDAAEQLTPLQKQYKAIKTKNPDCVLLFRISDFYETYDKDAETISKVLGVTLTRRKDGWTLAGFPHYELDNYLPKLIAAKFRVAICDRLEEPKIKK